MPVVRLQCPACQVVVKVESEIASKHPIVRCAGCKGLVHVAEHRFTEPALSASHEKFRKKSRSARRDMPVRLIVGGILGLVALVGLGIGSYFLISHFTTSGPEQFAKQNIALLQKMVNAIEGIHQPSDVETAMNTMVSCIKEASELSAKQKQEKILGSPEDMQQAMEKYLPEMLALQRRLSTALAGLSGNPRIEQALKEYTAAHAAEMNNAMQTALMMGQASYMPTLPTGSQKSNNYTPPATTQAPPHSTGETLNQQNAAKQARMETLLNQKSMKAQLLPAMLSGIRDNTSAEFALSSIDTVLPSILETEEQLKQLVRENVVPETPPGLKAIAQLQKTTSEIVVHLQRLEQSPDLADVRSRLVKKLTEAGLITAESLATNPPPKSDSNPFETVGKGGDKSTDSASGKNPFEPTRPGTPRIPMKTADTTPSGNSALDIVLEKLTSREFFHKQEGLREISNLKVDEAYKPRILEALLALFDDRDIHQKNDVLKVCKKWATTQEDKEKIGQHAETLLADSWAKKDAIRFFGEGKVLSASKEVARLLKDQFEQKLAAEALIAMGSEAEKSVLPYVTDLEPSVRHMAIEVLARIGTKESIPELQKVQNDRFVGTAARQAIRIINGRKKE